MTSANEQRDGADRAEQARPAAGADEQQHGAVDDVRADQGGKPQAELGDGDHDAHEVPAEVEQAQQHLSEHGSGPQDQEESK